MYPFSPRAVCRVFVCTALNRNSRIVGQVGSDNFLFCMQSFESALLPLPCEREIFDVSPLYADTTRSRCKPQSRSLQIEFCDFRQRFLPWQRAFARVYSTFAWRFAWLIAILRFVSRTSADSAVSAPKDPCPTWSFRILPVYAPGFALYGLGRYSRRYEADDGAGVHER